MIPLLFNLHIMLLAMIHYPAICFYFLLKKNKNIFTLQNDPTGLSLSMQQIKKKSRLTFKNEWQSMDIYVE